MNNKVYIINAFPERREALEAELSKQGRDCDVHWVNAPRGVEARSRNLYACRRWRDPHAKRLMTWGEMGCFAGHLDAWRRIADDDAPGAIILEDDARLLAPLADAKVRGDITYLGGKLLEKPGEPVEGLMEAPYTYWTVGYRLSREAAAKLVKGLNPQAILPTDEYMSYHFGRNPNVDPERLEQSPCLDLEAWALPEWIVEPSGRFGSGTEESPSAFALDTCVFASDPAQAGEALTAYGKLGYHPRVLGSGEPGWDTAGPDGIRKLRWLREALVEDEAPRQSVVLAVDGYDTLPVVSGEELLRRFAGMGSDLVIAGERTCWPEKTLAARFDTLAGGDPAPYRYPCSGTFMGFGEDMLAALQDVDNPQHGDDQLYLQRRILDDPAPWRIDREAYVFQSLSHAEGDVDRRDGWPFNSTTRCYPALLHANGPSNLDTARPLDYREPELDERVGAWMEVADGILAMPFLQPEACGALLRMASAVPALWQPLKGDNVPGDELRIKRLDGALWDGLTAALAEHLAPVIEARWRPSIWKHPCDAFLIRYSPESQPAIRLHEDISYFSCSIRLRKACAGGELLFPRQNFSDTLIPDGWLLCWPSRITHPHQVRPVRKGSRVSLVVWTPEREP